MPNSYGFSDRDLMFILDTIRRHLEKDQHPELWLFGSRATGKQKIYSDIDLLLTGTALSEKQLSDIKADLEESSLAYKADLVQESELYTPYKNEVGQQKIFLAKL